MSIVCKLFNIGKAYLGSTGIGSAYVGDNKVFGTEENEIPEDALTFDFSDNNTISYLCMTGLSGCIGRGKTIYVWDNANEEIIDAQNHDSFDGDLLNIPVASCLADIEDEGKPTIVKIWSPDTIALSTSSEKAFFGVQMNANDTPSCKVSGCLNSLYNGATSGLPTYAFASLFRSMYITDVENFSVKFSDGGSDYMLYQCFGPYLNLSRDTYDKDWFTIDHMNGYTIKGKYMFSECFCSGSTAPFPDFSTVKLIQGTYAFYRFADSSSLYGEIDFSDLRSLSPSHCLEAAFRNNSSVTSFKLYSGGNIFVGQSALASAFEYCDNLTELPKCSLRIENVSACESTFEGCSSLLYADQLTIYSVKSNKACASMFGDCSELRTMPNMVNVRTLDECSDAFTTMFQNCSSLSHFELGFDTENSSTDSTSLPDTIFSNMLVGCSNIRAIMYYGPMGDVITRTAGSDTGVANFGLVNIMYAANIDTEAPFGHVYCSSYEDGDLSGTTYAYTSATNANNGPLFGSSSDNWQFHTIPSVPDGFLTFTNSSETEDVVMGVGARLHTGSSWIKEEATAYSTTYALKSDGSYNYLCREFFYYDDNNVIRCMPIAFCTVSSGMLNNMRENAIGKVKIRPGKTLRMFGQGYKYTGNANASGRCACTIVGEDTDAQHGTLVVGGHIKYLDTDALVDDAYKSWSFAVLFYGNTQLKEVGNIFGQGISYSRSYAFNSIFADCTYLESCYVPDAHISYGLYQFATGCPAMKTVHMLLTIVKSTYAKHMQYSFVGSQHIENIIFEGYLYTNTSLISGATWLLVSNTSSLTFDFIPVNSSTDNTYYVGDSGLNVSLHYNETLAATKASEDKTMFTPTMFLEYFFGNSSQVTATNLGSVD